MPASLAGACGLLAFVTATVGWVAGGFAQAAAYSVARDDIWVAFVGVWLLREPAPAPETATPPPAQPATP